MSGGGGLSRRASLLFNPKRFAIATILYIAGPLPLSKLREATGLSWGDLDSNLRRLAREGIVSLERRLTNDGFRTFAMLTIEGMAAYRELARYLENTLSAALRSSSPRKGGPEGGEPHKSVGGHQR